MNATEYALADLAQFEAETLAAIAGLRAELDASIRLAPDTLPSYECGQWKF